MFFRNARLNVLDAFLADCHQAFRIYARTPIWSASAGLALAIGIGTFAAFVSLYADLALKPHPGFNDGSRISTVAFTNGASRLGLSYERVSSLADELTSVDAAAMSRQTSVLVGSEEISGEMVSSDFFFGLRPRLALGRGFRPEDHLPEAEPVVVLSSAYWQSKYGGDPNVLGTLLEIKRNPTYTYYDSSGFRPTEPASDSAEFRVIGIMASSLPYIENPDSSLWLPLERAAPLFWGVSEALDRSTSRAVYIRRAPGASSASVVNELAARVSDPSQSPLAPPGFRLDSMDGIVYQFELQRSAVHQLELFLAGSVILAIVATGNVSLFMLVLASRRRREFAIRIAAGAPGPRLSLQVATEAIVFVVITAICAIGIGVWLTGLIRGLVYFRDIEWREATIFDWRVLMLTLGFASFLALLLASVQVASRCRTFNSATANQVAARATPAQRVVGSVQVALLGPIGGAALALAWFLALLTLGDPGYRLDSLSRVTLVERGATRHIDESRQWLESIPGVTSATFGSPVPGEGYSSLPTVQVADPDDPTVMRDVHVGTLESRFVDLLGLELLYGRTPEANEPSVIVVNETLARTFWGREDVVGEVLPIPSGSEGAEVVGVLADVSYDHPAAAPRSVAFTAYVSPSSPRALIETALSATELRRAIERLVEAGEIEVQIDEIRSLESLFSEMVAADRTRAYLTITSSTLVIVLAIMGLYGTQSYLVAAGRREYAIRMALGSSPQRIRRLVIHRGVTLAAPGVLLGLILAYIVIAWLQDALITREISAALSVMIVMAGLTIVAICASIGPAIQASRVAPAILLRGA